eukprot:COSAG06_NODE_27250_length_597_cov_0.614458_1_plen_182_part_10
MCATGVVEPACLGGRRLCHTCRVVRPLRSKHDQYCRTARTRNWALLRHPNDINGKCVTRFDHHCPWVGTAVGFRNHPVFLVYCASATVCMQTTVYICYRFIVASDRTVLGTLWQWPTVSITIFFTMFFSLFSGLMFAQHSYNMLVCNITTNEHINKWRYPHFKPDGTGGLRNPFDRGTAANT